MYHVPYILVSNIDGSSSFKVSVEDASVIMGKDLATCNDKDEWVELFGIPHDTVKYYKPVLDKVYVFDFECIGQENV